MSGAATVKRERAAGYRILAFAVLFSLAWHLFWLAMVKVVAPAPAPASQASFSKVAFLGRIFAKAGMEVRSQPAERSFLEKRYNELAARIAPTSGAPYVSMDAAATEPAGRRPQDDAIIYLINEALGETKAEPDYGSE
jgi:hypothetical protein